MWFIKSDDLLINLEQVESMKSKIKLDSPEEHITEIVLASGHRFTLYKHVDQIVEENVVQLERNVHGAH